MRLRLIRKLADRLDGFDVTHCQRGDLIDVASEHAPVMVAEHWAVYARRRSDMYPNEAAGADRRRRSSDLHERLEHKREEIDRDRRHLRRRVTDVGVFDAA